MINAPIEHGFSTDKGDLSDTSCIEIGVELRDRVIGFFFDVCKVREAEFATVVTTGFKMPIEGDWKGHSSLWVVRCHEDTPICDIRVLRKLSYLYL
jgi:hypothetical protein